MARSLSILGRVNAPRIYAAASGVVQFSLVCVDPSTDKQVALANPLDSALMPAIGIVERVLGDGRVLVEGRHGHCVTNPGWAWTRGQVLWADPGTPGGVTAVLPVTGEQQRIGHAASATSISLGVEREIAL